MKRAATVAVATAVVTRQKQRYRRCCRRHPAAGAGANTDASMRLAMSGRGIIDAYASESCNGEPDAGAGAVTANDGVTAHMRP